MAIQKKTSQAGIDSLNEDLASEREKLFENQKQYNVLVASSSTEQSNLNNTINRLKAKNKSLNRALADEADASKLSLKERSQLQTKNQDLDRKLRSANQKLETNRKKILELSETQVGQLIPFSKDMIMPTIRYRDPFPKGVKWPRSIDVVAINVLVSESGKVEDLVILPGQNIDQELIQSGSS